MSLWMTLPVVSVTTRFTVVLNPSVGYSARLLTPGARELVYFGGFSPALMMSALKPPVQATVRPVGQLQSWTVIVLAEPFVVQARMTIG